MSEFQHVTVFGAGLIGGALARRIREQYGCTVRLTAVDQPGVLQRCESSTLFDFCTPEFCLALQTCDLLLLCAPPETNLEFLRKLTQKNLKMVVVDVSSVKSPFHQLLDRLPMSETQFIGGHPFFGSERSGFEHSAEVVVQGKVFCLVPSASTSDSTFTKVANWFSSLGLQVKVTDARTHDRVVARTSHLVQLLAVLIGSVIHDDIVAEGKSDLLVLSGGGLDAVSRLMASPPELWTEIMWANRAEFLPVLSKVGKMIQEIETATEREQFSAAVAQQFRKSNQTKAAMQRNGCIWQTKSEQFH